MTTILYVDDDVLVGKAIARSITRRLNVAVHVAVHNRTDPIDPIGYDFAILDWSPHGPQMVAWCEKRGVPFLVFTGDPTQVPSELPVVAKPDAAGELIDAIRQHLKPAPGTLEQLAEAMIRGDSSVCDGDIWHAQLPTFGGPAPSDGYALSWDKGRVLVGTHAGDLRILTREEHHNG